MKESKEAISEKIFFTGGGSGGHLNTAIGVINYLNLNNKNIWDKIVFVGGDIGMIGESTGSIESKKIPPLGVKYIQIRAGKLHRQLNLTTIRLLLKVFGGFIDSFKVIRKYKPKLIFSTGGYVTLPLCIVGKLMGSKIIIHEQTIATGLSNRIIGMFAEKILLSFPESAKFFPKKNIVLTGNIIQKNRFHVNIPESIAQDYKLFLQNITKKDKLFIFFTGGGLGSHVINEWVLSNLEYLNKNYYVILQTGENGVFKDFEKIQDRILSKNYSSVWITKWFDQEIGYILKNADCVVCRPGANTVLELIATNSKAILIPISWSSKGEQLENAKFFIQNQTGYIVNQSDIEKELLNKIDKLVLETSIKSEDLIVKNADYLISKEILNLID